MPGSTYRSTCSPSPEGSASSRWHHTSVIAIKGSEGDVRVVSDPMDPDPPNTLAMHTSQHTGYGRCDGQLGGTDRLEVNVHRTEQEHSHSTLALRCVR